LVVEKFTYRTNCMTYDLEIDEYIRDGVWEDSCDTLMDEITRFQKSSSIALKLKWFLLFGNVR
jgi:hypothetical protein